MGTGSLVRRVIDLDKVDETFNKLGLNSAVISIVELRNGQYLMGGTFTVANGDFNPQRLVRLNTDGTIDTTFDTRDGGLGLNGGVRSIVELRNGQYLVGGFFSGANGNFDPQRLVRLNTDGTIDESFDTRNGGLGLNTSVQSIVELSTGSEEGKYLVGGSFTEANGDTDNKYIIRTGTEVFT